MNYCSHCAGPVIFEIPQGDNRSRYICTACDRIHYQNPQMVVGCIPVWGDRILLCKRNIEPRKGFWTLPAGYLECQETTEEGARRETSEETGATVIGLQPYRLFDIAHIGQVYLMFLARLKTPDFHVTEESMDVRLFEEKDIPWSSIAFPVITKTLQNYFDDRQTKEFAFRQDQITGRIA
jgi:ADP-ribose pyrophosphatase YjhB (NUDIX family)